uniref:Uncharacterized protein n=1 Tax=Opuntia streptacantha TaxID=393608 RepID=A0A7C8ZED0_OPUST
MAIVGDVVGGIFATFAPHRSHPLRSSTHSSSMLEHSGFLNGGLNVSDIKPKNLSSMTKRLSVQSWSNLGFGVTESISQDAEAFLLNAVDMNIYERLNLAWKVIFPSRRMRRSSNAMIAKQRLKMILFSDRCAVSDEAKRKIVKSVVSALSDFVEIESQDKVQLNVTTDTNLGTVYSVTVPVRRVKPEYQEVDEAGSIMNVDYRDNGETSGSVDVRFDFYVPNDSAMS